jgi:uncharacterized protein (DUF2235 family)
VKKRLIVCCDGTWQTLDTIYPTNVAKIAQGIKPIATDGTLQLVFYDSGIGTSWGQRILGGGIGKGIDEKILNAYRFLCLNYSKGDEIYLFGFSRGAYTVRSLSGLISRCGLLSRDRIRQTGAAYFRFYRDYSIKNRDDVRAQEFRRRNKAIEAKIDLLGCWDTVASLGIPNLIDLPKSLQFLDLGTWDDWKYRFHKDTLNQVVLNALHAVAVDEHRQVFDVTRMKKDPTAPDQKLKQVWFPGEHGCVGGGTRDHRGLSDGALKWMIDEITNYGLALDIDPMLIQYSGLQDDGKEEQLKFGILPDPLIPFLRGGWTKFGFAGRNFRSVDSFEALDNSTKIRWQKMEPLYRPKNLEQFQQQLDQHM